MKRKATIPLPIQLVPVRVDSPQERLATYIAIHLCRHQGRDGMWQLPTAISIMGSIQKAIDAGDIEKAIEYFQEDWRSSDRWWLEQYPKSRRAGLIRKNRLPGQARHAMGAYY